MSDCLTADRLRSLLRYDQDTGVMTWAVDRGNRAVGTVAGGKDTKGRVRFMIDGRTYQVHRLAWLYSCGAWPDGEIDHINCDPADNRLSNLRQATRSQNLANSRRRVRTNTSGFKGVTWSKHANRWRARISVDGRLHSLGHFNTPEEAHAAYVAKANEFFGEFARPA